nr:MAG TPA: hypothetical protein [Caudoviricetes sp.]
MGRGLKQVHPLSHRAPLRFFSGGYFWRNNPIFLRHFKRPTRPFLTLKLIFRHFWYCSWYIPTDFVLNSSHKIQSNGHLLMFAVSFAT